MHFQIITNRRFINEVGRREISFSQTQMTWIILVSRILNVFVENTKYGIICGNKLKKKAAHCSVSVLLVGLLSTCKLT